MSKKPRFYAICKKGSPRDLASYDGLMQIYKSKGAAKKALAMHNRTGNFMDADIYPVRIIPHYLGEGAKP